ncbi:MAG: YhbY family RNA-binding protein [Sphaerochaetaceae bacterium]|jgi:RNA-binding protein|nr:YhbY family RNA-binding protein [Sphaerochaetaceae bacterium]MDX9809104.1 YhbY family RNA-binding protein [Sphaerochaetaceae bacterium]NLV83667.1 YhbY family RNA-binding protein [Spirochaetales bacterium]
MDSRVRNFLRQRAHERKSVVMVGKMGVDERVAQALSEALTAHELVKVKLLGHADERRTLADQLAKMTQSEVVSIIGNIVTLFKQNEDPQKRLVHIPKELRY